MKKRNKIALSISAIVVALGIGIQGYTNYKIDQTLQKFPYHLQDNLSLQVNQTNENFFSRDLVFSIEDENKGNTEFISTKLNVLPFMINAESQLPEKFVRELNKRFNITIDKNTINSKFSVFSDNLLSDIVIEFRDLTNKPQTLSLDLNFVSDTKQMEIKTKLTGLNYDNNTKLEDMTGKLNLIPLDNNQYDIATLNLQIKNADIAILNGENTRFKFTDADYSFSKNNGGKVYDTNNKFTAKSFIVSNKNRSEAEHQSTVKNLSVQLKQNLAVNPVSLYDLLAKLLDENASYVELDKSKLADSLVSLLFDNEGLSITLSAESVDVPKNDKPYLVLNNSKLELSLDNKDRDNIGLDLALKFDHLEQNRLSENKTWTLKGFDYKQKIENIDLDKRLALIPFYIKVLNNSRDFESLITQKDNEKFIKVLNELASTYKETTNAELNLKYFNYPNESTIENLILNYSEKPQGESYLYNLNVKAKKLLLESEGIKIDNFTLNNPIKENNHKNAFKVGFCDSINRLDVLLCMNNLSYDTRSKRNSDHLAKMDAELNKSNLSFDIDTYPETGSTNFKLEFEGKLSEVENGKSRSEIEENKWQNATGYLDLVMSKNIFQDNEKAKEIKQKSTVWRILNASILQEEKLKPNLIEKDGNFSLRYEKKDGKSYLNGKDIDQINIPNENSEQEIPESELKH